MSITGAQEECNGESIQSRSAESAQPSPFSVLLQNNLGINDFLWCVDEWPTINHDDFVGGEGLPVISLLPLLNEGNHESPEDEIIAKKVVEASEQWGFFILVDHGVPREVIEGFQEQCAKLFDLPMTQKQKAPRSAASPWGYSASNPDYGQNLPWAEILQLLQSPEQILGFSRKVWGDEDPRHKLFSDALMDYMSALDKLGMTLLRLLARGLDLPEEFFAKNFNEKESLMLRVNRYPPCPDPHRILGLGSHSDPHSLTILLQDQVGGLQVLKEDDRCWAGVRPIPNSFVVNIGDTLEAWSNGRLKSVLHRAVVNKTKQRMSAAYFLSPSTETLISWPQDSDSAEEENNKYCRKYIPFTWGEFRRELLIQRRVKAKTALQRYLLPTAVAPISQ